jgi:O-acetylhomoserine/O-acetylserine sulfhydrylase-like pyridoxal-dependent enzyme
MLPKLHGTWRFFRIRTLKVKRVNYPGLKSDSRFHLAVKYFNGIPGTIMTFDLNQKLLAFLL